jgi:hypothetical protein
VTAPPSTPPSTGRPLGDARLLADLRTEVGWLRSGRARRRFPAALQVGRLAGPRRTAVLADASAYDAGLRADVVSRLLDRLPPDGPPGPRTGPAAWLSRPGDLEPQDVDLAWLAASQIAFAMHGRAPAGFYVVTRAGWLDLRSGERRVWKRLRLSR